MPMPPDMPGDEIDPRVFRTIPTMTGELDPVVDTAFQAGVLHGELMAALKLVKQVQQTVHPALLKRAGYPHFVAHGVELKSTLNDARRAIAIGLDLTRDMADEPPPDTRS